MDDGRIKKKTFKNKKVGCKGKLSTHPRSWKKNKKIDLRITMNRF
jgi:hypothetical protein